MSGIHVIIKENSEPSRAEQLDNFEINQKEVKKDETNRLTGKFVSHNVINLSKRDLTEAENSLLSKGLKFCPTPRDIDLGKIKTDLEDFGLVAMQVYISLFVIDKTIFSFDISKNIKVLIVFSGYIMK